MKPNGIWHDIRSIMSLKLMQIAVRIAPLDERQSASFALIGHIGRTFKFTAPVRKLDALNRDVVEVLIHNHMKRAGWSDEELKSVGLDPKNSIKQ